MFTKCAFLISTLFFFLCSMVKADENQFSVQLVETLEADRWSVTTGTAKLDLFGLKKIIVQNRSPGAKPVSIIVSKSSRKTDPLDDQVSAHLHHVSAVVDFSGRMSDEFLVNMSDDAPLRVLVAPASRVSDEAVLSLTRYKGLEFLDLGGCKISDKSFGSLAKLKYLRVLCLAKTGISEKKLVELKARLPFCQFSDELLRW